MHIYMKQKLFPIVYIMALLSINSCSEQTKKSDAHNKNAHISIEGNAFVCNGTEIYLNGANTPWDKWNDFGGEYDSVFWEQEMKNLADNGMNSTRIWISCDGEEQPFIAENGRCEKPTEAFWNNLDHMLFHAEKNGIYIMAAIMSFDHFKDENENYKGWRAMIMDSANIQLFIKNYVLELVSRYSHNPYFFSIDLCNEPEWIHENKECGQIPWKHLQQYAGLCAAAIHKTQTPILVSIGATSVKWASDVYENGNIWSDENLQLHTNNDSLAYMDYWHIHYYSWMRDFFSSPFEKSPNDYALNDKPVIIGETPGRAEYYGFDISLEEIFEKPYTLGYSGVMVWTSNDAGIGDFGSLSTFGHASKAFAEKYPQLIHKKNQNN